jgi:hypothetical protein
MSFLKTYDLAGFNLRFHHRFHHLVKGQGLAKAQVKGQHQAHPHHHRLLLFLNNKRKHLQLTQVVLEDAYSASHMYG